MYTLRISKLFSSQIIDKQLFRLYCIKELKNTCRNIVFRTNFDPSSISVWYKVIDSKLYDVRTPWRGDVYHVRLQRRAGYPTEAEINNLNIKILVVLSIELIQVISLFISEQLNKREDGQINFFKKCLDLTGIFYFYM